MPEAERQFRKIIGYRDLATLLIAIERDHRRRHTAHIPTKEAAIVVVASPSHRTVAKRPKGEDMGKVIMMNWVTLDGVMQGPGRPDEDTRDGFAHGGWGIPYGDEATVAKMGERMGGDRAFLFGRRTYEDLLASWNAKGGPFKDALNNAPKYVASSNPTARLGWPNSTLLHGDVPATVADLKESSGTNLVIMGSGVLISSLMAADLIDEYLLMIAPVVLGAGRRLFAGGTQASLRLVDSSTTTRGVLIATYEPARG
jgi:dihydrofolate reductase